MLAFLGPFCNFPLKLFKVGDSPFSSLSLSLSLFLSLSLMDPGSNEIGCQALPEVKKESFLIAKIIDMTQDLHIFLTIVRPSSHHRSHPAYWDKYNGTFFQLIRPSWQKPHIELWFVGRCWERKLASLGTFYFYQEPVRGLSGTKKH